ncbi:hypothetical protein PRIPAC_92606 [Pristionchus pacificus]|uniref:Uncharacterized protein n=1 Tax=Pristionchus pacificus TaxID=54126 RepID=A0A2A6CCR4_PRIPA|nr:hypothetical protein PRIPAC_92606 [Pristionchus pacificus]|eukprot:PDM75992.1 hypothetical protein PRIPAC_39596 [Pristionchus pacificus]
MVGRAKRGEHEGGRGREEANNQYANQHIEFAEHLKRTIFRACRFLLIFVIFDSVIAITDSVMGMGFNTLINPDALTTQATCRRLQRTAVVAFWAQIKISEGHSSFKIKEFCSLGYWLVKAASFIILLGLTNPCLLATIGHGAYRSQLRKLFGLRKEKQMWHDVQTTINTDQYFSQLANEWEGQNIHKRKRDYRRRYTADGVGNCETIKL